MATMGYQCVLIGAYRYPAGDASANRLLSLAKTFRAAGYRPLIINDDLSSSRPAPVGSYEGVDHLILPGARSEHPGRLGRLLGRLGRPRRIRRALASINPDGPRPAFASVPSGLYTPGMHCAITVLTPTRTIADIVERHDPEQFPRGRLAPYFIRHRAASWLASHLANRVLTISATLENRYAGRPTLTLPPAVDVSTFAPHRTDTADGRRLTLLYMGRPTGKDLLGAMLRAALLLGPSATERLEIIVAGVDRAELAASAEVGADLLDRSQAFLKVAGPLQREQVKRLLSTVDFTFLLRPAGGYAAAGFPSKVPESLAAGCPLILNLTSDLDRYLTDGADALVSRGVDEAAVADVLCRALALSPPQLAAMSGRARDTAEREFDYHVWAPRLRDFLLDQRPAGSHG